MLHRSKKPTKEKVGRVDNFDVEKIAAQKKFNRQAAIERKNKKEPPKEDDRLTKALNRITALTNTINNQIETINSGLREQKAVLEQLVESDKKVHSDIDPVDPEPTKE